MAARFIMQEGTNTAIIVKGTDEVPVLAHFDQLRQPPIQTDNSPETQASREAPAENHVMDTITEPIDAGQVRRSTRVNFGVPPERFQPWKGRCWLVANY